MTGLMDAAAELDNGSEIVMALGWTAARYLEAGAEGEVWDRADRIRQEGARLMT